MKYLFLFILLSISNPNKLPRVHFSNSYVSYSIYDCDYLDSDDGQVIPHIKGGFAPYTFFWKGPEGFYSTDSIINNLTSGTYYLRVEDMLCGVLTDTIEVWATNPENIGLDYLRLHEVFPNPFDDHIMVKLSSFTEKPITIKLVDMKGSTILHESRLIKGGSEEFKIDIPEVIPGLYQLLIYGPDNRILTQKLTKLGRV